MSLNFAPPFLTLTDLSYSHLCKYHVPGPMSFLLAIYDVADKIAQTYRMSYVNEDIFTSEAYAFRLYCFAPHTETHFIVVH